MDCWEFFVKISPGPHRRASFKPVKYFCAAFVKAFTGVGSDRCTTTCSVAAAALTRKATNNDEVPQAYQKVDELSQHRYLLSRIYTSRHGHGGRNQLNCATKN
uniref:Uncharacterized protein n=1 Tax=Romanomermis culicivorax TaxID=13658 RepID=A0A915JBK8_ROMCU